MLAFPPWALTGWPWPLQALVALADLAWYGIHRHCHEGRGRLGRCMWRTHAHHHLPEQVYVFMHAAGHPIQAASVRMVLLLPAILLGLSPEAAFAAALGGKDRSAFPADSAWVRLLSLPFRR